MTVGPPRADYRSDTPPMPPPAPAPRRRILAVFVPFGCALAAVAWEALEAGAFTTPEGRTWIVLGGVAASESIPLLLVWAGLIGDWIGPLSLRVSGAAGATAYGLGLLVAAAYVAATLATNPVIAARVLDPHALQLLGLAAALAAGLLEEAVFRRLVMDALARRGAGALVQIIVSAATFGIAHAAWGAVAGSLQVALVAAGATGLLGAGLGLTYLVGRRSLGPCVVSHVLVDVVLEPWLIYAALGGGLG